MWSILFHFEVESQRGKDEYLPVSQSWLVSGLLCPCTGSSPKPHRIFVHLHHFNLPVPLIFRQLCGAFSKAAKICFTGETTWALCQLQTHIPWRKTSVSCLWFFLCSSAFKRFLLKSFIQGITLCSIVWFCCSRCLLNLETCEFHGMRVPEIAWHLGWWLLPWACLV